MAWKWIWNKAYEEGWQDAKEFYDKEHRYKPHKYECPKHGTIELETTLGATYTGKNRCPFCFDEYFEQQGVCLVTPVKSDL